MRGDAVRRHAMRRSGSVLLAVVVVGAIVAVLGTSMLTVGYHARVRAVRAAQAMAARVAADAGLARGMRALRSQFEDGTLDPSALPSATDVSIPNFEGTFTYAVTAGPSDGYTVASTGEFQGARRTVEAVMEPRGMIHEYALFGSEALMLNSTAKVDWYNYESGDDPLGIGTNSANQDAVLLQSNSYIHGDVVVGVGGNPDDVIQNNGGTYTGSAYAQSDKYRPPAVSVPAYLVSSPAGTPINDNRTISSSGKYTAINLGNSEKLVIDGNVELYITGNVTLDLLAAIQINEGCSLVLYVDGNVEGKNGSAFNNRTQDPKRFKLFGTDRCSQITLKNSGDMYAIVYAPAAGVTVYNSATVWGSITSRVCDVKTSAAMHYDGSLRDYIDPALPPILKLASWREY